MSWKDIGLKLGISDTRVLQIFDVAILKIKRALKEPEFSDLLADFLDCIDQLDSDKPIRIRIEDL